MGNAKLEISGCNISIVYYNLNSKEFGMLCKM